MKFQQIGALFCCVLVISGCASTTSHDFFYEPVFSRRR